MQELTKFSSWIDWDSFRCKWNKSNSRRGTLLAHITGKERGHTGMIVSSLNYYHQDSVSHFLSLSLSLSPSPLDLLFSTFWHYSHSYWIYPTSISWEKEETWLTTLILYHPIHKKQRNYISTYKSPGKTE